MQVISESSHLIQQVEKYLEEEVRPVAQQMDHDPEVLRRGLDGLFRHEAMALKRGPAFGGPGASPLEVQQFQIAVARTSGALAFLQTQHQSAVSIIGSGNNPELKQEYLPHMADGRKRVGIGFSQLRRKGPPITTAGRVEGGYVISGHVPWITGYTFYNEFIVGAALPDGENLLAIVPFQNLKGVSISEPMKLATMESAQTVTADLVQFFVPDSKIADVKPANWIARSDQINVALQGYFAMGCARAGLDILQSTAAKKSSAKALESHDKLLGEWNECLAALSNSSPDTTDESTAERLNYRAWAIELAARCAHAAVTVSSGAANSINHPAQRVYREALVFTVSAQTSEIMEATLARIAKLM